MLSKLNHITNFPDTPSGRLCSKLQDFTGTGNVYAYSPNSKQHAVRRIYNGLTNELYNIRWDANGNLAQQTVYSVNNNVPAYQNMRALYWDEDDRLNLVAGDGYLSYYAYGHDGNRAIKMTGSAAIDQTGTLLNSTNLENITIYPNEYLTVTQAEYTKYYYAGGNRIASKIGTGGFEKMQRLCTQDLNLSANANTLFGNALQQIVNITNQPNDEFPVNVCGGYSVATELLADPLPNFYINSLNLNFTQNNLLQQFRQNLTGGTEAVYFFHSDHLGSASWITNNTGLPVQHLLYLPFGEHFVNERNTAYDERFTFTGKERDLETGYYYFGARFDDVDLGFMSVDPMADKYPSMTPYNYCAWNPVKLVDPEGEEMNPIIDYSGKLLGSDVSGYKGTPIVMDKDDYVENMSFEEAKSKGVFLSEYGKGISISDNDWQKIVDNGGEKMEPFLSNKTNETIFFKPDKSVNGYLDNRAYPLKANMDLYMPIDGIKTKDMSPNEVYKVVDGTKVTVTPNNNYFSFVTYLCAKSPIRPQISTRSANLKGFLGNIVIGGYKMAPDKGWYALRDAFKVL